MRVILQRCGQTRTLVNGTFGVQLCGDIGPANDVHGTTRRDQRVSQAAFGQLPGTKNNGVRFDNARVFSCFTLGHMQPLRVDFFIIHATDHVDILHLQTGPVDPARGLAKAAPQFLSLTLQQGDLPDGGLWLGALGAQPAACF